MLHQMLTDELWRYDPRAEAVLQLTHWFNLAEGAVWLIFAGLVFRRWLRHRNSLVWEGSYALSFVTFALTDFREAWVLTGTLLLIKAANLAILLTLRRIVLRRYYPARRTW